MDDKRRWEDNIKTHHTEGYGGVRCICMMYNRDNASIEINRWVYKSPYDSNNNNNNNRPYNRKTVQVECKSKDDTVIIGATGTFSKSFRKYVSNVPGKHEVKELQKTAILGTAHILRKVLM